MHRCSCRLPGRLRRAHAGRGAQGGERAVNPFATSDRMVVLTRPQDMRAGINRLSASSLDERHHRRMVGVLVARGDANDGTGNGAVR